MCFSPFSGVVTFEQISAFLDTFTCYEDLWLKDKKIVLAKFHQNQPSLLDFEAKMRSYRALESNIAQILPTCDIGCLSLQTEALRNSLKSEISVWQTMYARSLIDMSLQKVSKVTNYMSSMEILIETPLDCINIERMRVFSSSIQEFYDLDSNFAKEIQPLSDGLHLLEQFEYSSSKDDMNLHVVQSQRWSRLQSSARLFEDALLKHRPQLLLAVQEDSQKISFEAMQAKSRLESHGPYSKSSVDVEGSVGRMLQLTSDLGDLIHRAQVCNDNEKLLQSPCTQFPNIHQMMTVVRQVEPVYQLYMKVKSLEKLAYEIPVSKLAFAVSNITTSCRSMTAAEASLDSSVRSIHVWSAYKQILSPWMHALPALEYLQSSALRPRHWILIMQTIKSTLPQSISPSVSFGLGRARVEASVEDLDVFLAAVRACANEGSHALGTTSGAMTNEFYSKVGAVTLNALSKMTTSSLMCLICCLPEACVHDLCQFPQMAQKEIQVEHGIECVEGCLADTLLSLSQSPKSETAPSDCDEDRFVCVLALQQAISAVHDCRTRLSILKEHPYGKVFLHSIGNLLMVTVNAESCLLLLKNVQDAWLRSRAFFSMAGSQAIQMLKPGDVRVLLDNRKLMTRVMAQITAAPNVLDICGPSSLVPKTLPIIWQNLESLASSISSMLLENRLKLPELFTLNDHEAAEVLSMGYNVRCMEGATESIFHKTFHMIPSIEGILVNVMSTDSSHDGGRRIEMQAAEMVTDCGERLMLLGHSSVHTSAVDTLRSAISAAKLYISVCYSSALQELFKQSSSKTDHRVAESSKRWMSDVLRVTPVQSLLLALWVFFTDLVESALERISSFASPPASCDEIFLETSKFLGLCSREISKTFSAETSTPRTHLEIVLTALMMLDEILKVLRDKVCNGQCTGPHNFDWFCHFRFYFNTSRGSGPGNMMVEVAGVSRAYTFQPVSASEAVALPMVAASARVAIAVVSAASGYMIPVLVGPAGEGKCAIVKCVAAWLAQPYLVIDACYDAAAAVRCSNAVAGGGYWGIVTNLHQLCSKDEVPSVELSEIRDGKHLGIFSFMSQVSLIIRTLAESRRNGRVGATVMVHGSALLLHASAAFVMCTRSAGASSSKPFSYFLRNMTRTVFVKQPPAELIFTIALRVNVGLPGSRCRIIANQLELLANCSSSFGGTVEGLPGFSKSIFVACVLAAAKKSSDEVQFIKMMTLEVRKRMNPISFCNYMDAHKLVLGSSFTNTEVDSDALVVASNLLNASLSATATDARDNVPLHSIGSDVSDVLEVIANVGLRSSPSFCENVLKLSSSIECCQSVMIVGCRGSGRSSIITAAIGLLKARSLRTNVHVTIMPSAHTRAQLFGAEDSGGHGIWLKGVFEYFLGSNLNSSPDNLSSADSQKSGSVEICDDSCNQMSRLCLELDCGLDGEFLDLLLPAIRGQKLPLNDGSGIPLHPNALFILKGSSFEKCSPTLLNLVPVIYCSIRDVQTSDIIECCIRRAVHPLKEHALKVAMVLLEPCISSPPPCIINASQYRHHTVAFFNAMMGRILSHDDVARDSEKNDSYAVIGEVKAADMERFAAFACIWAAGAELDTESRIELTNRMRAYDLSGWFPVDVAQNKTFFDYFPICDVANGGRWIEWGAAFPTGTSLNNILCQTSQNFNRNHTVLNPCLQRLYVPTQQSVAMTFLCDLLFPRSSKV